MSALTTKVGGKPTKDGAVSGARSAAINALRSPAGPRGGVSEAIGARQQRRVGVLNKGPGVMVTPEVGIDQNLASRDGIAPVADSQG